ncbi:hypothetical protein Tco_1436039 [Tanacetum coccineum]
MEKPRLRVISEEPEHFGEHALPRPPRTIRVRPQSKIGGDRVRDERENEVIPFSKDCGGHESATNRHTRDGSGRCGYYQRPKGTNPRGISTTNTKLIDVDR